MLFDVQDDLLVFRSYPPLPEIFWPFNQRPSSQQPACVSHPDLDVLETLSDADSDDHATLAEYLKGKMGGGESFDREGSPKDEAATSCPKRPRTTVHKRKASIAIRYQIDWHNLSFNAMTRLLISSVILVSY